MSEIRSFISEADLEAARKVRQAEWEKVRKPDDPLERPEEVYENRSLYERLKEQKDKTQAEYEESHKLKNMIRGLNDDEVQFLDLVDRTKEKMETQRLQEDYYEIKSFQKAVASLADKTLEQKLEFKRTATAPLASAKGIKNSSDSENLSAKKLKPETAETNTKCDESANTPDTTNEVKLSTVPTVKCIGILPGLGIYSDSSDSDDSSSDSVLKQTAKYDLLGRPKFQNPDD